MVRRRKPSCGVKEHVQKVVPFIGHGKHHLFCGETQIRNLDAPHGISAVGAIAPHEACADPDRNGLIDGIAGVGDQPRLGARPACRNARSMIFCVDDPCVR